MRQRKVLKPSNRYHAKWMACSTPSHGLHRSASEAAYCDRLARMQHRGEIEGYDTRVPLVLAGGTWRADFWIWPPGPAFCNAPEVHVVEGAKALTRSGAAAMLWRRIQREIAATYPSIKVRVFRLRGGNRWVEDQP